MILMIISCLSNRYANVTMSYKASWKMQMEILRKIKVKFLKLISLKVLNMSLTSAPFSRSNSTQSASDTMQAQCRGFSVPWVQFTSAPYGKEFRSCRRDLMEKGLLSLNTL